MKSILAVLFLETFFFPNVATGSASSNVFGGSSSSDSTSVDGGSASKSRGSADLVSNYTNITCPDIGWPPCSFSGIAEDLGVWVCRNETESSPSADEAFEVETKCIDTTESLDGDTCGFCPGVVPVTCTCACGPTPSTPDGVLVQLHRKNGKSRNKKKRQSKPITLCVYAAEANSLVNTPGKFECVKSCPII